MYVFFILQEALAFVVNEFRDQITYVSSDGTPQPRITSWTGIRYMLSEVSVSYCLGTHQTIIVRAVSLFICLPLQGMDDVIICLFSCRHYFELHVWMENGQWKKTCLFLHNLKSEGQTLNLFLERLMTVSFYACLLFFFEEKMPSIVMY